MNVSLDELIKTGKELHAEKYSDSKVIFLAGSILRGEGTPFSDLDLVVVYERLPVAFRQTYYYQGFLVEAFINDPETLNYFIAETDCPRGFPVMMGMVLEGIELPAASEFSQNLKQLARSYYEKGPPPLKLETIDWQRYTITNLIDDLRSPRTRADLIGAATELYPALADFYFRSNNLWSAKGKSIPRILRKADADLCQRYCAAFDELFSEGKAEKIIELAEEILKPAGGFLIEIERLDAPAKWRKPLT